MRRRRSQGDDAARRALAAKQFVQAKGMFAAYAREHPGDVEAEMGVGDAELALRQYEAAEATYRRVTAARPEMWRAHKNLVIVEAALGRWEEFERERAGAAAGARARRAGDYWQRESDVIDSFDVTTRAGAREHWIVREYYEPVGRSLTRYNFELFGSDGRVKAYVSLESGEAAARALAGGDVVVGVDAPVTAGEGLGAELLHRRGARNGGAVSSRRADVSGGAARCDAVGAAVKAGIRPPARPYPRSEM